MSTPIFEFKGYSITNLIYSKQLIPNMEIQIEDDKEKFDLGIQQAFTKDLKKGKLSIKVELALREEQGYLILEVDGFFDLLEGLFINDDKKERSEEEFESLFLSNSTAILFPYIRSIVTQVTVLDSEQGVILPTLNLRSFEN